MKYDLLGLYIEEFSIRNKNLENQNVYSVTNSEGFIRSTDFFNKVVFSKDLANYKVVLPNYFAYNPSRLNVGSIDFLSSSDGVIVSPLYVIFKCNDLLFSEYLKRYLKSKTGQMQIKSKTKGAVRDTVSFSSLAEMRIPLPPLADQIHIAHILSQAEALIAQRKESIRLLDELVKSKFLEMFGDPVKNEFVALSKFATVTSGITKGKKYANKATEFVSYMRVANVQDGYFDLAEIKEIEATAEEIRKYDLNKGDLLLTEGGDPDKLGRGSLWNGEVKKCIFQNHIFRVRIFDRNLNPIYLSFLTSSTYGKKYFLKSAKQTTGIASINSTQLKNFPVFLPDIHLQEEFSVIVEKIEILRKNHIRSLIQLEILYSSLSQKAFNGELMITQKSSSKVSVPRLARETSLHVIATDSNKERTTLQKIDKIKAAFSSKKEEQSFLKRKILGSYIINQSLDDSQFGDVKFEKLLHLSEYLILKRNFGQHYVQKVAGPYDNKFTILFFQQIEKDRWFRRIKEGKQFHFQQGEKHESSTKTYNYFSEEELGAIQGLIGLFKKANYEKVEVVSTLYAVWNNRIIKGEPIEDNLLKEDFLNWDPKKEKYQNRLDNAIVWMREKNLVPDGWGPLIEKTK
ncbi:restriction endonuclease subunit S [Leptospira interrogans]|uniref:restriction endonuclease subunit S n=1 Tax=Leptospira interrogans TaxID=173 RepID=UPI00122D2141|nr:restriction endonuclease subunit S [Leptospira interrogans]KAA1267856.1 type I restriction endonuclease subunit S [Leptospira interrogans serovar Weerasinghe]ULG79098.1 restriction endonuclease subunit S [Leptospira interrogans]UML69823.1 restriction endonuclease subunit S [Leptospira interrogans]UML73145.1 restriction endonuclease subunit S [Leptospira interrogans]